MNPKEAIGSAIASVAFKESKRHINFEIEDPEGNFEQARRHLESDGSILAIMNHVHRLDTLTLGHVFEENLTTLDRVGAITALRYVDSDRGKLFPFLINGLSIAKGYSIFPVVQGKNEEQTHYTKNPKALKGKDIDSFNSASIRRSLRHLRTPRNVLLFAPEGRRSEDGVIQEPYEGTYDLARLGGSATLILPLAFNPPFNRSDILIRPGALFSIAEIDEEHDEAIEKYGSAELDKSGLVMLRVAERIDPEYQGIYRPHILQAA